MRVVVAVLGTVPKGLEKRTGKTGDPKKKPDHPDCMTPDQLEFVGDAWILEEISDFREKKKNTC